MMTALVAAGTAMSAEVGTKPAALMTQRASDGVAAANTKLAAFWEARPLPTCSGGELSPAPPNQRSP